MAGDDQSAWQTASRCDVDHDGASMAIAEAQAARGDVDAATRTAYSIEDDVMRWTAVRAVATEQARSGAVEAAREVARQIEERTEQARALTDIAILAGDAEGLVNTRESLLSLAPEETWLFDKIATKQVELGLPDEALRTIRDGRSSSLRLCTAFADAGDREHFRHVIVDGALDLDPRSAYRICGLLASLYPEQAEGIADVLASRLEELLG